MEIIMCRSSQAQVGRLGCHPKKSGVARTEPRCDLARCGAIEHASRMSSAPRPESVSNYASPSELRRQRVREQAAAVCYRVGNRGIEFLLVRTRGGRWTFPKGGVEPGLSHAESAALEAFEEAGVHGRIELAAFARYRHRKGSKSGERSMVVQAHLCEVKRLAKPKERKRERTWFLADKAKRRLREGREPEFGLELAAVVDRAEARVRRLHGGWNREASGLAGNVSRDALQAVCFESPYMRFRLGTKGQNAAGYVRREVPALATIEVMDRGPQKLLPGEIVPIHSAAARRKPTGNDPKPPRA